MSRRRIMPKAEEYPVSVCLNVRIDLSCCLSSLGTPKPLGVATELPCIHYPWLAKHAFSRNPKNSWISKAKPHLHLAWILRWMRVHGRYRITQGARSSESCRGTVMCPISLRGSAVYFCSMFWISF